MSRVATNAAHIHTRPVPVPRVPGLHAPQRQSNVVRDPRLLPISNASSTKAYTGAELRANTRHGAMDAQRLPSRMGDRLHWRDGRVTDMQGNPLTNHS